MRRFQFWGAGAVAVLIVLGITVAYFPLGGSHSPATSTSSALASTTTVSGVDGTSVVRAEAHGGSAQNWLLDSPEFDGNSVTIDYPPGYSALANFTLGLINADRASAGLGPIALSSVPSGQQHADSMAYYGYFSHWDNQGYKPYMRYTLLGGTGATTENLAVNTCSSSPGGSSPVPTSCTLQTIENAINSSEWGMMNNDSACCENNHRENILGPLHTGVSLGVAYNSTTVYLVEDFEDNYIGSESLQVSSGTVTFSGSLNEPWAPMTHSAGAEISVFFDPTPGPIAPGDLTDTRSCRANSELNETAACEYEGAYDPGSPVATVLPPCLPGECAAGSYVYAESWQDTSGSFQIVFSMSQLQSEHGSGVYTLYLWPQERVPEPITSLSIFVAG